MMSSSVFHVLTKPTGAICNLDCKYCCFLSKEELYPNSKFRMTDEVLDRYIRQQFESQGGPEVNISWQGGEPTLRGNPSTGGYMGAMQETAGCPHAYNIEADPKERLNVMHLNAWLFAPYLQLVGEYREPLKKYPNPPAPSLTEIRN